MHNYPLNLIFTNDYIKKENPSITELLKPLRAMILTRQFPDKADKTMSMKSFLGTAFHSEASKRLSKHENFNSEMNIEHPEGIVSGTIDLYDKDTNTVYDFKLTSVKSFIYGNNNDNYTEQLNGYAWLLRTKNIEVKKLIIIQVYYDWSYADMKKIKDYPDEDSQILLIPVWSYDYQQQYFMDRISTFQTTFASNELPICSDKEMWKNDPKFAVTKNNAIKATKVCDTLEEAEQYFTDKNLSEDMYYIEQRLAEPKYCKYYCPARFICQENQLFI